MRIMEMGESRRTTSGIINVVLGAFIIRRPLVPEYEESGSSLLPN